MKSCLVISTLLSLAVSAVGQTSPLSVVDLVHVVGSGDAIAGVGNVTAIGFIGIDDDGSTVIGVDTDNPMVAFDGVVLRDGAVLLQEGLPLTAPPGATLSHIGFGVDVNAQQQSAHILAIAGGGFISALGLYVNDTLVLVRDDVSAASGLSPGWEYVSFYDVAINNGGTALVSTLIADPSPPFGHHEAMMLANVDAQGQLVSEQLLYKQQSGLPGQPYTIDFLGSPMGGLALNNVSQTMVTMTLSGVSGQHWAVVKDGSVVAMEQQASPVAGRDWADLVYGDIALNDAGGHLILGRLDGDPGTDLLIEKSGTVFRQERDLLVTGELQTRLLSAFGTSQSAFGPVHLGNNGNVLWYGRFTEPDATKNVGLFLNDQILVQTGVSTLDGLTIKGLRGGEGGFVLSDDGQWVLGVATLSDNSTAVFKVHVGPWVPLGQGLAGTAGLTPQLRGKGTLAPGAPFTLDLLAALPGSTATLVYSLSNLSAPFKGGTLVPNPDFLLAGLLVGAGGDHSLALTFPTGIPSEVDLYLQSWVADTGGAAGFAASNGLKATTP